jgi:hypothetical protein
MSELQESIRTYALRATAVAALAGVVLAGCKDGAPPGAKAYNGPSITVGDKTPVTNQDNSNSPCGDTKGVASHETPDWVYPTGQGLGDIYGIRDGDGLTIVDRPGHHCDTSPGSFTWVTGTPNNK